MTLRPHLLPASSMPLEQVLSESMDRTPELGGPIETARGIKYQRPINPAYAPWVLAQYGLGGVSAYFNSAEAAIDAGIPWQRVRGTVQAIETALAWIDYVDVFIEHEKQRRRKWNRYQIAMGMTPAEELPRLFDAEYLVGLSDPARSVFYRGFHGYDVRALEWSGMRWGRSIWGADSGVRLDGGTVKWSHGETDAGTIIAGEAERIALGVNVQAGDQLSWGDFPWNAPGVTWDGIVDVAAFRSFLLRRLPILVAFYDPDGGTIGYRRPFAIRDITATALPGGSSIVIEVECRTAFGDGEGQQAASCSLVFRAANPLKPGRLWNEPGEIVFEDGYEPAAMSIGAVPLDFTFRRTVRQHVKLTLEI